jgi:RNA polymerase sigma factor (sigma-70 family)
MTSGSDGTAATNTDLLLALKDQSNDQAWTAFCARYRPVLIAFARHLGLSEPDAQDAAQDSLFAFANAYRQGEYDRGKGRLRAWLFSIAAHKVRDIQRRICRRPANLEGPSGTDWAEAVPDDHRMSDIWESQWHKAMLDACMDEVARHVEPATLQAFRLYVLEDREVDAVAAELNMTRNAVFKAQRRVLARLREAYERLTLDE